MAKNKSKRATDVVKKNHSFYWDTDLTQNEVDAIDAFIEELSPENKVLLDKLLCDVREEAYENGREYEQSWQ